MIVYGHVYLTISTFNLAIIFQDFLFSMRSAPWVLHRSQILPTDGNAEWYPCPLLPTDEKDTETAGWISIAFRVGLRITIPIWTMANRVVFAGMWQVCILVQVTIYRRLLIGRDGHLDQSEAYDIS